MMLPCGAIDDLKEFDRLLEDAKTDKVTIYAVWRPIGSNYVRFDRVFLDAKTKHSSSHLSPVTATTDNFKVSQESYQAELALYENTYGYHLFKNFFWAWAYCLRLQGELK